MMSNSKSADIKEKIAKMNGKIDLSDFSFLIPLHVDGMLRIENIIMSVRYLLRHFVTNIYVLQTGSYENGIIPKLLDKRINYRFIEDRDPVFYRTKYLNMMTKEANTPLVGIWDTDIIIPKEQIVDSIQKLRDGYEIAYPYDGHFYDTTDIIRELFWKTNNLNVLIRNKDKMGLIYGNNMKGGAMFVNKSAYMNGGMENENFYGWGPEDWERYERWKIVGFRIYQSSGCLYHLTHNRGLNSQFRSIEQMTSSNKVLRNTAFCNKDNIFEEISKFKSNNCL